MTIGLTIPGVQILHPREVWQPFSGVPTIPNCNPPKVTASDITQPVAHYTAADDLIDGDPGEHAHELPAYLAAIHRDYWNNRGYAVGYRWAIDWLGGAWELRGFEYKSAANAGHNNYTDPILFLVDGADHANSLMWATARAIWRETKRRSQNPSFRNRPLGHGELFTTTGNGTPTACPGGGILADLHAGKGDLDYETPSGDDMSAIDPIRLLDTRQLGGPAQVGQRIVLFPPDRPASSSGVIVNITVTETAGPGFVTAWRGGNKPNVSNVNYDGPGQTVANVAVVPLADDGSFTLSPAVSDCHLVVDQQGWA